VDLDATVVMLNELGATIDAVYYNQLSSECGSITHSGDQREGGLDGYDELITIDLSRINFGICYLPILINSYKGNFSNVECATVSFL
jgi:tellurium resistance protein TerZ